MKFYIFEKAFVSFFNSLKTGEPNLGSCHMTQSEQKKETQQIFWAKLSEKPSVTSQYPSKCARSFIYGCTLI